MTRIASAALTTSDASGIEWRGAGPRVGDLMSVHLFGEIGEAAGRRGRDRLEGGGEREDSQLGRGAARSRRALGARPAAGDAGAQFDRGLSRLFPEFRRRPRPFRQSHRQRSLRAWTATVYELERKPGEKHTLHGGPNGFGRKIWKLGSHRCVLGDARSRIARRRRRLSRRLDRDLRLPAAGARDPARRAQRDAATGRRSSTSPSTPISISTARATCATTN